MVEDANRKGTRGWMDWVFELSAKDRNIVSVILDLTVEEHTVVRLARA